MRSGRKLPESSVLRAQLLELRSLLLLLLLLLELVLLVSSSSPELLEPVEDDVE